MFSTSAHGERQSQQLHRAPAVVNTHRRYQRSITQNWVATEHPDNRTLWHEEPERETGKSARCPENRFALTVTSWATPLLTSRSGIRLGCVQ